MDRHRTTKSAPLNDQSVNRLATRQRVAADRVAKKAAKSAARRKRHAQVAALGDAAPAPKVPRTLDACRTRDADTRAITAGEVAVDATADEVAPIYRGDAVPHVVVTTGLGAGKKASHGFAASLLGVVPNSEFLERCNLTPAAFMHHATGIGATDVLLEQEDHKRLSTLTHVHLPDGPSAVWRLTSVVEASRIRGHGAALPDRLEVHLNNVSTVLGHRIGRMLGALFGGGVGVAGRARQAVTWRNQRYFVSFRFHRYVFKAEGEKVALQERGPRFKLRLNRLLWGAWAARAKGVGGNSVAPAVQPCVESAATADGDEEEERDDEDENGEAVAADAAADEAARATDAMARGAGAAAGRAGVLREDAAEVTDGALPSAARGAGAAACTAQVAAADAGAAATDTATAERGAGAAAGTAQVATADAGAAATDAATVATDAVIRGPEVAVGTAVVAKERAAASAHQAAASAVDAAGDAK